MDIEKTIQFLTGIAAQHDERLAKIEVNFAKIEDNNLLIQQALLRLVENQNVLQTSLETTQRMIRDTQTAMKELDEKTDRRISNLVSAIAKLSELRPN